jgi:hypothetical protein
LKEAQRKAIVEANEAQRAKIEKEKRQRAVEKTIAEKIAEALKLIKECEKLADETGVEFGWDLAYGMGGYYLPESHPDAKETGESGWMSSSRNC